MALLQVKTSFNIDLQFETVAFHLRLLAWVIDIVLLCLFYLLMSALIDKTISIDQAADFGIVELFLVFPFLIYHFLFELLCKGQSIGKMIMKIKVVSLNGQTANVSQYLLRWLLRFVDFGFFWGIVFLFTGNTFLGGVLVLGNMISFLLFVTTPYNQRLGDIVAGTTIVLNKLPYTLSDTIFQDIDIKYYQVTFPQVMRLSDKDINIVDNIIKKHNKSNIDAYVQTVAHKIKSVLQIEHDMPDEMFLETLLRDYNYLSRK